MSQDPPNLPPDSPEPPPEPPPPDPSDNPGPGPDAAAPNPGSAKPEDSGYISQGIRHAAISARVPESVTGGIFSTGAIVLQGPHEFVLDFLMSLTRPHQVAARVVLPPTVVGQVIAALKDNLQKYEARFGPPKELPKPTNQRRPTIQEIYDDLKLPDEKLSGVYANAVIIAHSPAEFSLDFLTSFFPRSAVSCRVFLAASQMPRLLETLSRSYEQYRQRLTRPPEEPPPEARD